MLWIRSAASSSSARVLLFPETVIPTWDDATDAFWNETVDRLRAAGRSIILGARIPRRGGSIPPPSEYVAALAALSGTMSTVATRGASQPKSGYFNAAIIRGAVRGTFKQRIPVPLAMWNPLESGGADIASLGPATIRIDHHRTAILICYEQLITWPAVTSLLQDPTILLAVSNVAWVNATPIPRFQRAAVTAWSRLFYLPVLIATND